MAIRRSVSRVSCTVIKYVERKPNGAFQYRRRIPVTVAKHYGGKVFYVKSLQRFKNCIEQRVIEITDQLDKEWKSLGWIPFEQEITASYPWPAVASKPVENAQASRQSDPIRKSRVLTLSAAMRLYLDFHDKGDHKKFKSDCERIVGQIIAKCGDLPLDVYTRQHAEDFRNSLLRKNATNSVRRSLNTATAVINKAKREKQLSFVNPFEGLGIPKESADSTVRIPFTCAELRIVSTACRNLNDDIRHIVASLIDTGCRVSEIVGLRIEDVILEGPIPYVRIRPFGKVRTLKTPASERDIPLVGDALWGAQRALEARRKAKEAGSWLFPRYASDKEIKATHASATLNKWLRSLDGVSDQKTCHCARHAMRDRLRAAQVPVEIQDVIGGWGTRTIGQGYGNGYPMVVLLENLSKIVDRYPADERPGRAP